jgi:hypothetical protein
VHERPAEGADIAPIADDAPGSEAVAARQAPSGLEQLRRMALRGVDRTSEAARPLASRFGRRLADAFAGRPPKTISAMVRVHNEEQYLEAAVESIAALVEEIVIVDNLSDDGTPQIIERLAAQYPDKVRAFRYPHRIARYGDEQVAQAATRAGRRSPAFLPNYCNWCVARCSHPYIMRWDGDTVATSALAGTLASFRESDAQVLWYTGINVQESREHFIKGRPYEDMEPRLFYRRFSRYDRSVGDVETLWSPYVKLFPEYSEHVLEPLYFDLKFCKDDRSTNISDDLRRTETVNAEPGDVLAPELQAQIAALRL